jgi:Smg protein
MFEVLAFVYDSYWSGAECPTLPTLHRKLNGLGFATEGILNALVWLEDLQTATHKSSGQTPHTAQHAGDASTEPRPSCRVLTTAELRKLGAEGWGLLTTLASNGSLPWERMELVIDRAMVTPGHMLELGQLKLIVLMVFWSLNPPADAVLNKSLLDNTTAHAVH